jgi:peptide deformylase
MIKNISQYPQPTSLNFAAPVRKIDDEILSIIQDLKDTIEENSLKALAAYQIGYPYTIIVVKEDNGEFLEIINPLVASMSGEQTTQESTGYFPGLSATVKRADKISIMYEDLDMNQKNLKADGEYSILLQRKIDYTFGSSFINKLDKQEKQYFENKLEFGAEAAMVGACPTNYKRDYITKFIDYLTIAMVLVLIASFFTFQDSPMFMYEVYIASSIVVLNIVYFFYAQYESKQYGTCTNCQIGDLLGTMAILLTRSMAILVLSYFII